MKQKYFNKPSRKRLLSYIDDQRFPEQFASELILRSLIEQLKIFIEVLKWDSILNTIQVEHISGYLVKELKRDILSDKYTNPPEFNTQYSLRYNVLTKLDAYIEDILFRTATLLNPIIQDSIISKKELKELKDRTKNLKIANPLEQKLFKEVWSVNKKCLDKNYKFEPYKTFIEINEKKKLVDSKHIQQKSFTHSKIFNRYSQFRMKKQNSSR